MKEVSASVEGYGVWPLVGTQAAQFSIRIIEKVVIGG
jgi:hypothetical protein